jgi:hypothetical protein
VDLNKTNFKFTDVSDFKKIEVREVLIKDKTGEIYILRL